MNVLDHFDVQEIVMKQFDILIGETKTFKPIPLTADNKPAAYYGKLVYHLAPEGGALLFPSEDGSTITIEAVVPMDFQTVTVGGDATTTPGETVITYQWQIRTIAGILDHFDVIEVTPPPAPPA